MRGESVRVMLSSVGLKALAVLASFSAGLQGCSPPPPTAEPEPVVLLVSQPSEREVYARGDVDMQFVVSGPVDRVTLLRNGSTFAALVPPYQYTYRVGGENDGEHRFKLVAEADGGTVTGPSFVVHLDRRPPRLVGVTGADGGAIDPWAPLELHFDEPVRVSDVEVTGQSGQVALKVDTAGALYSPQAVLVPEGAWWPPGQSLHGSLLGVTDRAGNQLAAPGLPGLFSGAGVAVKGWEDRTPPDLESLDRCSPLLVRDEPPRVYLRGTDTTGAPGTWSSDGAGWTKVRSSNNTLGRAWIGLDGAPWALGLAAPRPGYVVERLSATSWLPAGSISGADGGMRVGNQCPALTTTSEGPFMLVNVTLCSGGTCAAEPTTYIALTDAGWVVEQGLPDRPTIYHFLANSQTLGLVGYDIVYFKPAGSTAWSSSYVPGLNSQGSNTASAALADGTSALLVAGKAYQVSTDGGVVDLQRVGRPEEREFQITAHTSIAVSTGGPTAYGPAFPPALVVRGGGPGSQAWRQVTLPPGLVRPYAHFDGLGRLWLADTAVPARLYLLR